MISEADIKIISSALSSGNLLLAERTCREVLRQDPRDADALLLLAIGLHSQKRLTEAVEIYAQLTRLQPGSGLHWANYATALRELADLQELPTQALQASAEAYRTAMERDPDNAGTLVNYGLLLLQQQDFPAAREVLLKAAELDPETPRTRIYAARACCTCRDAGAGELIRPWRQWTLLDETLQLELAGLLVTLGDAASAAVVLEAILLRRPQHLQAQIQMAIIHERMNRPAQAEAMLRNIADTQPDLDEASRREITHQLATLMLRRGEPASARAMLERTGPRDDTDYAHYFALAGACDLLDDRGAVLDALQIAHARQIREMKQVAPHRFTADAPLLTAAVEHVDATQYARWPPLQAPGMRQSPVFIVGFPRSGTTLLEQMLDAHAGMQSMDERPFFNVLVDKLATLGVQVPRDIHALGQHDCDELRSHYWQLVCDKVARDWQTQLVDKNPLNMLWLPLIHRLFPHARVILAVRHPCDVILSCYMQNFHSTVLAVAGASLERLARTYVAAMQYWLRHVQLFESDVLVVRHEDLVADFEAQAQRLAGFLEIGDAGSLADFAMHARRKGFIGTPSYSQVIEPVNRRGLNRWARYHRPLEPILPILEPMLRHWNYASEPDA